MSSPMEHIFNEANDHPTSISSNEGNNNLAPTPLVEDNNNLELPSSSDEDSKELQELYYKILEVVPQEKLKQLLNAPENFRASAFNKMDVNHNTFFNKITMNEHDEILDKETSQIIKSTKSKLIALQIKIKKILAEYDAKNLKKQLDKLKSLKLNIFPTQLKSDINEVVDEVITCTIKNILSTANTWDNLISAFAENQQVFLLHVLVHHLSHAYQTSKSFKKLMLENINDLPAVLQPGIKAIVVAQMNEWYQIVKEAKDIIGNYPDLRLYYMRCQSYFPKEISSEKHLYYFWEPCGENEEEIVNACEQYFNFIYQEQIQEKFDSIIGKIKTKYSNSNITKMANFEENLNLSYCLSVAKDTALNAYKEKKSAPDYRCLTGFYWVFLIEKMTSVFMKNYNDMIDIAIEQYDNLIKENPEQAPNIVEYFQKKSDDFSNYESVRAKERKRQKEIEQAAREANHNQLLLLKQHEDEKRLKLKQEKLDLEKRETLKNLLIQNLTSLDKDQNLLLERILKGENTHDSISETEFLLLTSKLGFKQKETDDGWLIQLGNLKETITSFHRPHGGSNKLDGNFIKTVKDILLYVGFSSNDITESNHTKIPSNNSKVGI